MQVLTVQCPQCGEPCAFPEIDEPGEHTVECRRPDCDGTWTIAFHTPKNAIVITGDEVKEYDKDGRSKEVTGKDKEDADNLFKKIKKTGVGVTPIDGGR